MFHISMYAKSHYLILFYFLTFLIISHRNIGRDNIDIHIYIHNKTCQMLKLIWNFLERVALDYLAKKIIIQINDLQKFVNSSIHIIPNNLKIIIFTYFFISI